MGRVLSLDELVNKLYKINDTDESSDSEPENVEKTKMKAARGRLTSSPTTPFEETAIVLNLNKMVICDNSSFPSYLHRSKFQRLKRGDRVAHVTRAESARQNNQQVNGQQLAVTLLLNNSMRQMREDTVAAGQNDHQEPENLAVALEIPRVTTGLSGPHTEEDVIGLVNNSALELSFGVVRGVREYDDVNDIINNPIEPSAETTLPQILPLGWINQGNENNLTQLATRNSNDDADESGIDDSYTSLTVGLREVPTLAVRTGTGFLVLDGPYTRSKSRAAAAVGLPSPCHHHEPAAKRGRKSTPAIKPAAVKKPAVAKKPKAAKRKGRKGKRAQNQEPPVKAPRQDCPLCQKNLSINSFRYHLTWAKVHQDNPIEARIALKVIFPGRRHLKK